VNFAVDQPLDESRLRSARIGSPTTVRHRRGVTLLVCLAMICGLGLFAVGSIAEQPPGTRLSRGRPAFPAPTGPHQIGTVTLHLVDHSRVDPWVSDQPVRELMVQLWYPARPVAGSPRARWQTPGVASEFLGDAAAMLGVPAAHGHVNAPVRQGLGPRPVVLYSPGFTESRGINTAVVEDLASHGYVVVTIDHPYEAKLVEFPGGRQVRQQGRQWRDLEKAVEVRQADTRFVLDQLTALHRGQVIDAEQQVLPHGLGRVFDLSRVGMFGFSLGGATTAAAMSADSRIKAGINLDGNLYGSVFRDGLDRPFLLIGSSDHDSTTDGNWEALWTRLRGWRLELRLAGTAHGSFIDAQFLVRPYAPKAWSENQIRDVIGDIDERRSVLALRTYVRAFFDLHLLGRPTSLLAGPSASWPEMRLMR